MAKVTLVHLPNKQLSNPLMYFSLGLLYIAAVLREHKHEVNIIDLRDKPLEDFWLEFDNKVDFVGFTATTAEIRDAKILGREIKQKHPQIITVVGGPHPSLLPEDCVGHFDCVVVGEGENEILNVVEWGARGTVHGGRVKDLDSVPFPAWDLIPPERLFSEELLAGEKYGKSERAMTIITSRGCYWGKCAFCLPTGTKIITSREPNTNIEKILIGDKLVAWDENNQTLAETEVVEVLSRTTDLLYQLTLFDGKRLLLTGEHPVMTETGWKETSDLAFEDKVLVIEPADKISFNKKLMNPMKNLETRQKVSKTTRGRSREWVSEANRNREISQESIKKCLTTKTARRLVNPDYGVFSKQARKRVSDRMRLDNPMKKSEIAQKMGMTIKKRIKEYWREFYTKLLSKKCANGFNCPHFVPVKSIQVKKLKKAVKVYNFQCSPYNNYFAHYVSVHNCGNPFDKPVIFRSPESIIAEIQELVTNYNVKCFRFEDDNFGTRIKDLTRFVELVKPLGIKYKGHVRAELFTKQMASLHKEAGCVEMGMGVESGDNDVLKIINKGETVEQFKEAVNILKNEGILSKVYLMSALPGETEKSAELTKQFMREAQPDKWTLSVFICYPGNAVWKDPEKYKVKIVNNDFENYWNFPNCCLHEFTDGTSAEELYNRYLNLYQYLKEEKWRN